MNYCVIGIGTFGYNLAISLAQHGMSVLAVDRDMNAVKHIQDKVSHAVCTHVIDEESLRELGIEKAETVIVCMGDNFEESVLITAILKQKFNIPMVVCRSTSVIHKEILELIGADYVILPEQEAGIRLADKLSTRYGNFIRITQQVSLVHIRPEKKWISKTIGEIDFEKKYGISLIGKRQGEVIVPLTDDSVLHSDDYLIVLGNNVDLEKLAL